MAGRILWVLGAYLAGTLPSTLIVARLRWNQGGRALVAEARRDTGELDPHILMTARIGAAWSAFAAATDVLKAMVYLVAARGLGDLPPSWLAACGVAIVLGHAFPFYAAHMSGRGLAAAAGVYLILLPWEMVVAGAVILLGLAVRNSGIATTVAMLSVPFVAALQGQPAAYVAMGAAVFVLIVARRLEGIGAVIGSGVPAGRAVLYRVLLDATAAPGGGTVAGHGEPTPPPVS
ncbi:MAG TPA: glycerol-3-phosphate acyltransferase [Actinomycetota bacterium]|nr:glycerol-3-phosphate acyltransferase [Actinomycetota bacterium]